MMMSAIAPEMPARNPRREAVKPSVSTLRQPRAVSIPLPPLHSCGRDAVTPPWPLVTRLAPILVFNLVH